MGIAARLAGVKIDYETEAVGYADLDQPAVLLASGELREADVRSVRLPGRASLPVCEDSTDSSFFALL
jgi:hypothetical protein